MSFPYTASKPLDLESGDGRRLYPNQVEIPALRWGFIRKVYSILAIQMLLTVAVACTVIFIPAIPHFIVHTKAGLAIFIISLIIPFILLCLMLACMDVHPVNLILLALYTLTLAFGIGLSCSFSKGKVVLEAFILTSVVVVSLTLYTFWAAKRGYDFSFLGPFLLSSLTVLVVFALFQIFHPLGKLGQMIYGCLGSILFSGYIIYDTDNLIKRFEYDEYVLAAISLYLDIINLFMSMLSFFNGADDD